MTEKTAMTYPATVRTYGGMSGDSGPLEKMKSLEPPPNSVLASSSGLGTEVTERGMKKPQKGR